MYTINRTIAILKPRQPYLDWACSVPDPIPISLDELRRDCTAVLLPEFSDDTQAEAYLQTIYLELFEQELAAWDTNPDDWPQERDYGIFRTWFDIELHSLVLDSVVSPIRREP